MAHSGRAVAGGEGRTLEISGYQRGEGWSIPGNQSTSRADAQILDLHLFRAGRQSVTPKARMQSSEKAVMGLQLSKSNPFAFQDKPGLTTKTIFKGFSGQPKGFLLWGSTV